MKIQDALKSRTVSFNLILGAVVPLFNSLFPKYALTNEVVNQILVFGNLALRFLTDGAVGGRELGNVEVKIKKEEPK